jgi:hypothetical protein
MRPANSAGCFYWLLCGIERFHNDAAKYWLIVAACSLKPLS